MITIEPIMDFDLEEFVRWIQIANPDFVNVGADSNTKKNYKFPEPSKDKILKLVAELKKFTKVINKANILRLMK
jgi:hypothetical protein